jgi:hypothetical protein
MGKTAPGTFPYFQKILSQITHESRIGTELPQKTKKSGFDHLQ